MSRQHWSETLTWTTSNGTAIANSTTETIIFPNVTIPANYMQDGRVLRGRAFGELSVTGTPTIKFSIRHGGVSGTVLGTTETITNGSGVTNVNWSIEFFLQTRSNGSSGTLLCFGEATVMTNDSGDPTAKTNVFSVTGSDGPAVATVDLTADWALALTATWGTASASNTLTGMFYTLETMN